MNFWMCTRCLANSNCQLPNSRRQGCPGRFCEIHPPVPSEAADVGSSTFAASTFDASSEIPLKHTFGCLGRVRFEMLGKWKSWSVQLLRPSWKCGLTLLLNHGFGVGKTRVVLVANRLPQNVEHPCSNQASPNHDRQDGQERSTAFSSPVSAARAWVAWPESDADCRHTRRNYRRDPSNCRCPLRRANLPSRLRRT